MDEKKTQAHTWPTDGSCVFGPWMTKTGLPKATQYRMCVHPECTKSEVREAPKS